MKLQIDINTRTFVRFWLVVIGFGLLGWFIYTTNPVLLIICIALFLALALNKPVSFITSRLPNRSRFSATVIAFSSVVVVIGAVLWFVVPPLVQQSAKFAESLPQLIDQAGNQWAVLNDFIDRNNLRGQVDTALGNLKTESANWAASVGGGIISSVGSIATFIVSMFLVLVLTFLMLLEGPTWMGRIWTLYTDDKKMKNHRRLVNRIYSVITGYINGQLTVSAVGAVASGIFVFIMGLIIPSVPTTLAMPTMLIVFIFTLIPMFGATIAGILVALMLILNNVTAAIVYVIFFVIYQQIENNLISPAIQAKKVELSALIILISVTLGVYVAGVFGGIIAIPIAGAVKILLEEYLQSRKAQKKSEKITFEQLKKKIINK